MNECRQKLKIQDENDNAPLLITRYLFKPSLLLSHRLPSTAIYSNIKLTRSIREVQFSSVQLFCQVLSVCLSVFPSVTLVDCIHTAEDIVELLFGPVAPSL